MSASSFFNDTVKNLSPNMRVAFYLLKKLEEKGILSEKDVMSIIKDSLQ